MRTVSDAISIISGVIFAVLALVLAVRWLRTRVAATGWIAGTFGVLAAFIGASQLQDGGGPDNDLVLKLLIALLALFPYLLFRFGAALEPAGRRMEIGAAVLTIAVVVAVIALPEVPREGAARPPSLQAFLILFIIQWASLSAIVAARLFVAARSQPNVVRRRIRLLGFAAIGLALALAIGGLISSEMHPAAALLVNILSVFSALAFFLGFLPPSMLRVYWRRREKEQVRESTMKLMSASTEEEVASSTLPHMAAVAGGRAVALLDERERITARFQVTEEMRADLERRGPQELTRDNAGSVLHLSFPFGHVVVWATPYAPLFGRDEIVLLRSIGALTNLALERVRLFARERQARRALESSNAELEQTTKELEQEVAERRRAEGDLIESQMQLAEAQEVTQLGSWSWDVERDHITWSDQLYRIYGLDPQEFDPNFEGYVEHIHPDDRELMRGVIDSLYSGEDSFSVDHRVMRPDGQVRTVNARGKVIRDVSGRPLKLIGTSQDITLRRQSEAALRASEMRFRNLAQSSPEAIVSADSNGHIVYWNRGAQDVFGYWEEEVLNRPLTILMPERYRESHLAGLKRYLQTGEGRLIGTTTEIEGLRKDGTEFPLELSLSTWVADSERYFSGILRDVSERRSVQEELARVSRRNELVLNAAAEGIFGLDREGLAQFINPAGAGMLGYEVDELVGRRVHDLVHHALPDGTPLPLEDCLMQRAMRENRILRTSDEVFWRKDGTSFPVEYMAAPIVEDGLITGVVVTFGDLSERREYERMKEVQRLKDEFISIVSHELRSPLTSIRGSLGLLVSGTLQDAPERAQRMLEIAVSNTDRLVRMLNDILDVERIQSGEMPLQPSVCDAAGVVRDTAEAMEGVALAAGITIVPAPSSGRLWADPDLLMQALTNLVANAIRFSDPGGRVEVSSRVTNGEAIFEVSDRGRGIPPEKLDIIFERFAQVDSSDSRERSGTGLGLAISKSIVERHGGRIWVESTLGEGSSFFIALRDIGIDDVTGEVAEPQDLTAG